MLIKRYDIIGNILLLVLIGMAFVINMGILGQTTATGFSLSLSFAKVYPLIFLTYLFIRKKEGKVMLNKKLIIILSALLFCYILGTFIPISTEGLNIVKGLWTDKYYFTYKESIWDKLVSLELFILILITAYVAYVDLIHNKYFKHFFKIAYFAFIIYLFLLIGYSLKTEMHIYKDLINGVDITHRMVQSFTNNPNIFAQLLLCGIILCVIDDIQRPKMYNFILSGCFFLVCIFTQSSTCLLLSATLIFFELIAGAIRMIGKNKKLHIKVHCIITFSVVAICLALMALSLATDKIPFFSKLGKYLIEALKSKGSETLDDRYLVYTLFFKAIIQNVSTIIFGFGYNRAYFYCPSLNNSFGAHNVYLQSWVDGGIILLAVVAFLLVFTFIRLIQKLKRGEKVLFAYMLPIILVIIVHSMFEASFKIGLGEGSLIYYLLIVLPIITKDFVVDTKKQTRFY